MKGRAQVLPMPLPRLGIGPNTWTVSVTGLEAPADVFDRDQFFYEYIARSVVEDPTAITRKLGRAYVKNQEICRAFLRAGANAQQEMPGAAEFFNYQVTRGGRTTSGSTPSGRRESTRPRPVRRARGRPS